METHLLAVVFALMALVISVSFTVGVVWGRRSAMKKNHGLPPKTDTMRELSGAPEMATPIIAEYDDNMDIPAALIGARCKEIIEQLAPILRVTPVNLLREAIAVGLTGGRPVTQEMLDFIEKERKAMGLPPPSKPGPVDPN